MEIIHLTYKCLKSIYTATRRLVVELYSLYSLINKSGLDYLTKGTTEAKGIKIHKPQEITKELQTPNVHAPDTQKYRTLYSYKKKLITETKETI